MFWSKPKETQKIGYWVVMRYASASSLRYLDAVTRRDVYAVEYLSDRIDNRDDLQAHLDYWANLLGVRYKGVV